MIIISLSVIFFCLVFFYFSNIGGSMDFRRSTDTEDQFLNKTVIKKEDYTRDSLLIVLGLKQLLLRQQGFFYSKEYYEGTNIMIDTILHSPDLHKLATLILTKNSTSRQLVPIKGKNYYYNATGYLVFEIMMHSI
jgi:hypothetical protein